MLVFFVLVFQHHDHQTSYNKKCKLSGVGEKFLILLFLKFLNNNLGYYSLLLLLTLILIQFLLKIKIRWTVTTTEKIAVSELKVV